MSETVTAKIKVSVNGLRQNLSDDCDRLRDIVISLKDALDQFEFEELAEAVNSVIQGSNVLNCLYLPDDPDFKNMGDVEVEFIDLED